MITTSRTYLGIGLILLNLALITTACQPGMLFGPEYTPTPTATLRPTVTPIPTITPTPDPAIIAGDWKGIFNFGEVTFTIQSDGMIANSRLYMIQDGGVKLFLMNPEDKLIKDFGFTDTLEVVDSTFTFHYIFMDKEGGLIEWEGQTPSGPVDGIGVLIRAKEE